jgi:hypothetical protein
MKHTSGPWRVLESTHKLSIEPRIVGCMRKSNKANAHLIAAAPEMLEALELFLQCEGSRDNEGLRQLAIARELAKEAIRKAKGE